MATQAQSEELKVLVNLAGSNRKAVEVIKSVKGYAPTNSAISKAINGGGASYTVQCYICDLKQGLDVK